MNDKRRQEIEEAAREITTTNGFTVLVDLEDFEKLSKHKWYAAEDGNTRYAITTLKLEGRGVTGKPKYKRVSMHRILLGAKKG